MATLAQRLLAWLPSSKGPGTHWSSKPEHALLLACLLEALQQMLLNTAAEIRAPSPEFPTHCLFWVVVYNHWQPTIYGEVWMPSLLMDFFFFAGGRHHNFLQLSQFLDYRRVWLMGRADYSIFVWVNCSYLRIEECKILHQLATRSACKELPESEWALW